MVYAVFENGGKQHRASQGDFLFLELLQADPGEEVTFDNVMLVSEDDELSVGTPFLNNSRVLATVVRHERLKKIRVIKFKRRKNYLRRAGHRQWVTVVKVTAIEN